jgi:hypothetical protein
MAMKKIVDVTCDQPFVIGYSSFAGICKEIVLDTDAILKCLENKAKVAEVLANGARVPLHFGNFDSDNGPSAVTQDAVLETDVEGQPPVNVEVITSAAKKDGAAPEVIEVNNNGVEVIKGEEVAEQPKVVEENVEPLDGKDVEVNEKHEEEAPEAIEKKDSKKKKK